MRRATQSHFIFTLTALPLLCASSTRAYEFRVRWVERVGTVDVVLGGPNAWLEDGTFSAHRIRLQFGVFDDAAGEAPFGGFLGWNVGTLAVSGPATNSDDTRTPGRLDPFTFASGHNANGNPPLPAGDPFTSLTDIDCTLGTQSPFWGFDGAGHPLPQPPATIRGFNTFVSIYEITVDPAANGFNYTITAAGNLIAASEWRVVGIPIPPDPDIILPGTITYAPVPLDPVAFSCTLVVYVIPAPGTAALLGIAGLLSCRRRR